MIQARRVFIAQVVLCMPDKGVALVHSQDQAEGGRPVLFAQLPIAAGATGTAVLSGISEGSWVQCVSQQGNSGHVCMITGLANALSTPRDKREDTDEDNNNNEYNKLGKTLGKALDKLAMLPQLLRNYNQNTGASALSGDTEIKDKSTGVGVELHRDAARLVGGPMAGVEVSDDGKAKLTGRAVSADTPLGNSELGQDYAVYGLAATLAEALGILDERPPMKKQALTSDEKASGEYFGDDKLVLEDETALPFYRLQGVAGSVAAGEEKIVVNAPDAARHDQDNEPAVLFRERTSMTGSYSVAGSERVSLVKTPYIPAISRLGYHGKPDNEDAIFRDLGERWTGEVPLEAFDKVDEATQLRDAPLHEFAERMLSDDYVDALAEKLQARGFSLFKVNKDNAAKPAVDIDAAVLPPPEADKVVDPVTGKEHLHYKTTSFITEEPDGSICICDGYGSEIRMSQGNIYISPALDLFLRPGRDISVMAGRHQAYNSQGSLTLNTSDAMLVRSGRRMSFCAGTADDANDDGLVLETRGESNGVVIRSGGDLAATAYGNVLLGRRAGSPATTAASAIKSGTVAIDTGASGTLYVNGGTAIAAEAGSIDICGINGIGDGGLGAGSAVRITPNNIDLVTSLVQVPAPMLLRAPGETASIKLPRNGNMRTVRLHTSTKGSEHLMIGGDLLVNGAATINTQLRVSGPLAALGISNTSEYCSKMRNSDRAELARKTKIIDPVGLSARAAAGAEALSALQRPGALLSDTFLASHIFSFPNDYGVSQSTVVPGMVWQEAAAGRKWLEQPVQDADGNATMPYPGANIWNGCQVSGAQGLLGPLKDQYRTNAKEIKV